MAKVLSISSQVVCGHVGNSIAAFVLQRMGHEVLSLPTIILSNRPGYKAIAGERSNPKKLQAILEAVAENGWLDGIDALATGYLPSAEIVELCRDWISRVKAINPKAIYLCDPIIGDEPSGIYIDSAAAEAIRAKLIPLADIMTPNAFELGWLSGGPVRDIASAVLAARALSRAVAVITSASAEAKDSLANILVEAEEVAATISPRRIIHAHGTGDFFASLFLAHKLNGAGTLNALRATAAAMDLVLEQSAGLTELPVVRTQAAWAQLDPPPAMLEAVNMIRFQW